MLQGFGVREGEGGIGQRVMKGVIECVKSNMCALCVSRLTATVHTHTHTYLKFKCSKPFQGVASLWVFEFCRLCVVAISKSQYASKVRQKYLHFRQTHNDVCMYSLCICIFFPVQGGRSI